jgi:cell division protein FtsX
VVRLSRGMRSALSAIIGLAARAEVTLFDEPYAGLDVIARWTFYDRLLADYAEHPRVINTCMLSVFERTHELGLLRAVGMSRRQVRTMIRSESVIIALVGGVVGIVVGTALGVALSSSLRNNGVINIALPIPSLVAFLVLSALLGLAGAAGPARRAANLDVLAAIASE